MVADLISNTRCCCRFGAGTDVFSREPFLALWESTGGGGERFGTAPCHVTPDRVPEELAEMPAVYAAATDRWGAGITTILLGDFNADCSYLSASELAGLELYTSALYSWLVDSAADTTVSGTDCAYDRIVVAGELAGSVTAADASVLRFDLDLNLTTDLAAEVSDHYPVRVLVPWGNATGTGSSSAAGAIRSVNRPLLWTNVCHFLIDMGAGVPSSSETSVTAHWNMQ